MDSPDGFIRQAMGQCCSTSCIPYPGSMIVFSGWISLRFTSASHPSTISSVCTKRAKELSQESPQFDGGEIDHQSIQGRKHQETSGSKNHYMCREMYDSALQKLLQSLTNIAPVRAFRLCYVVHRSMWLISTSQYPYFRKV